MRKVIFVSLAVVLAGQSPVAGVTRLVPSGYPTIQAAIDAAAPGATVVVAPGIYTGEGNRDINFLGKTITVRSTKPNDPNVVAATIIDCNGTEGEPHRGFYFHNKEHANSVLSGFTVTNGHAYHGGGIYCGYSGPTITHCVIRANTANMNGGGICCYGSGAIISNCTFSDNFAAYGGGIYTHVGEVRLTGCIIRGNGARVGGGMYDEASMVSIANCIFSGNSARSGGGMCNGKASRPTLANCTFSGNWAESGGAIWDNRWEKTVSNCILWGNDSDEIFPFYANTVISHSNIRGGCVGAGSIDADPCFVGIGYWADANDPNIMIEPNDPNAVWIDGDYRLLPDSPCIDAGDNNSVPADTTDLDGDGNTTEAIPWDIDGNPRIEDGNNDGLAVVDMGAYEYFLPPVEVEMKFTPQALNPGSKGKWVKAHFVLPEGYAVEDVDVNSPAKITEPFEPDIDSNYVDVFINDDNLVEVEAAFERGVFCEADISDETIEVMVIGSFMNGQQFFGTDTIKVTTSYFKHLGVLASYWLEQECGKPDWCEGADLDQDSEVDFVDLALYDGCCIEVVGE